MSSATVGQNSKRLLIAGPASGAGKSTICLALLGALLDKGQHSQHSRFKKISKKKFGEKFGKKSGKFRKNQKKIGKNSGKKSEKISGKNSENPEKFRGKIRKNFREQIGKNSSGEVDDMSGASRRPLGQRLVARGRRGKTPFTSDFRRENPSQMRF